MATPEKLLKFLTIPNVAEELDEEQCQQIADDVVQGLRVDEKTREDWLRVNRQAMDIIKHCEDPSSTKADLYEGQSKVMYPLLAPAGIQLASRTTTHVTRNGRTVECAILGPDKQVATPESLQQAQQIIAQASQSLPQVPPDQAQAMVQQAQQQAQAAVKYVWEKQDKASRVSDFLNYEFLIENKNWLADEHKLNTIVAFWGVGFKQVYYDFITKRNCSELIHPKDVIINHNVSCLDKAPRITTKHWFSKNEIISQINAGYFLDHDLALLQSESTDLEDDQINDTEEKDPVYEFVCQTCNIDLDDDGYAEPYKCYVHVPAKLLFCIIPAYDEKGIYVNEDTGKVYRVERQLDIVDRHLIDSPDGSYYSLGLNYLLLHTNKSITSILRQLIDAGTLANAGAVSGFVTKAFRTKEREIRIKLGKFQVLDCNPSVDPQAQFVKMPFGEPSQVLLGLLQLLIDTGKNSGFLSDILTGDVEMQNVPATTMMAMVEQGTRAFKPIITKLYISLKNEFDIWFRLHSKYLDKPKYAKFQGKMFSVDKNDFDLDVLDIAPVADPTASSEAHTYAKLRALIEGLQVFGPVTNMKEAATRYYTDMQFNDPEKLVQDQQQPDVKMVEVQLKSQIAQLELQLQEKDLQLEAVKIENKKADTDIKTSIKATESQAKITKMQHDAYIDVEKVKIEKQQADTDEKALEIEAKKVEAMKQNKDSKKGE